MNKGATVCHHCGRTQPAVIALRVRWVLIAAAILAILGVGFYFISDYNAQTRAIEWLVLCQKAHGIQDANYNNVNGEVIEATRSGIGWREAVKVVAAVSGCGDQSD